MPTGAEDCLHEQSAWRQPDPSTRLAGMDSLYGLDRARRVRTASSAAGGDVQLRRLQRAGLHIRSGADLVTIWGTAPPKAQRNPAKPLSALSSVGQSNSLLSCGSLVRVQQGAPLTNEIPRELLHIIEMNGNNPGYCPRPVRDLGLVVSGVLALALLSATPASHPGGPDPGNVLAAVPGREVRVV